MWPAAWTARARARPRPEEQPVMSHVCGEEGVVKEGLKSMVEACMVVYVGLAWTGLGLMSVKKGSCGVFILSFRDASRHT